MSLISITLFAQEIPDSTIKKNIAVIDNPLERIIQLKPRQFEYDTDTFKKFKFQQGQQYGFIAEDIESVFPNLVNEKSVSYTYGKNATRNTRIKTVDEKSLIPVIIASMKEQQLQIEKLKAELEKLKTHVMQLTR
ncbi:MAG TPA: tail fiber domain-containing protein [Agriterribacter sp.]|nr:tail fiber domain-containing protein [Agriterribacter sp.]